MKKDWLLVTSSLLSGIGQVTLKYRDLLESKGHTVDVVQFFDGLVPTSKYRRCMYYVIPTPETVKIIPKLRKVCKKLYLMTICETETVHPNYGLLKNYTDTVFTPSQFCKDILSKQFLGMKFVFVPHWVPVPEGIEDTKNRALERVLSKDTYKFYVIGNIVDYRKQVGRIIDAFTNLKLENCELVLKATCSRSITMNVPNVIVINGLLPQEELDYVHSRCHCYVSFSFSEGVGMGCVEAAMRSKPVIITEYGGTKEYVHTPYTIKCGRREVGIDDFLFRKEMIWGNPDFSQLVAFMKECHEKDLKHMTHFLTENKMENLYDTYLSHM